MIPFSMMTTPTIDYIINKFSNGKGLDSLRLIPTEEDFDLEESYMDMFDEGLAFHKNDISGIDNFIDQMREGFKYLYGKYPEDITEENIKDLTVDEIKRRAETALEEINK